MARFPEIKGYVAICARIYGETEKAYKVSINDNSGPYREGSFFWIPKSVCKMGKVQDIMEEYPPFEVIAYVKWWFYKNNGGKLREVERA